MEIFTNFFFFEQSFTINTGHFATVIIQESGILLLWSKKDIIIHFRVIEGNDKIRSHVLIMVTANNRYAERNSPLQDKRPTVTPMSLQGCKLSALLLHSIRPTSVCGHRSDRLQGKLMIKLKVEKGELLRAHTFKEARRQWRAPINKHQCPGYITREALWASGRPVLEWGLKKHTTPHAVLFPFRYDIIWKPHTFLSLPMYLKTKKQTFLVVQIWAHFSTE